MLRSMLAFLVSAWCVDLAHRTEVVFWMHANTSFCTVQQQRERFQSAVGTPQWSTCRICRGQAYLLRLQQLGDIFAFIDYVASLTTLPKIESWAQGNSKSKEGLSCILSCWGVRSI